MTMMLSVKNYASGHSKGAWPWRGLEARLGAQPRRAGAFGAFHEPPAALSARLQCGAADGPVPVTKRSERLQMT